MKKLPFYLFPIGSISELLLANSFIDIGGSYFTESNNELRFGGHGMLTLPLFQFLHLSLDAQYNTFDNVNDPLLGFQDFYMRTILTATS